MSLREELEKKLRAIYFSADSDVFGLIADEVVRQMKWARAYARDVTIEEIIGDDVACEAYGISPYCIKEGLASGKEWLAPAPISVAPEDWKPS